MLNRRELLKGAAGASILRASEPSYRFRGYLGWITDLDSRPDPHAAWPSMRLDETLLAEYRRTFRLMRQLGYNGIVVWGLYVSRDWPADIPTAVTPERGQLVSRLIASAHAEGIRVSSGLGVFSWGFEELIRVYPSLSRTNPKAMCASNPESWAWMEKITDFVFRRFPIDGVSMQSADQGRCNCRQCSRWSDSEYHARINAREADYIRSKWSGKTVAVNGWGQKFEDPASLPNMIAMGRKADYLIDVGDGTREAGGANRRKVIRSLPCAFGTIGGRQVEPPQHWARGRWFLPTPRAQGEHLTALAADGGRACEYFFHILANPGDEVSFWVAGKLMNDVATPWRKHLESALEELYNVTKRPVVEALADLFARAEHAYLQYIPERTATISMEPLVENYAGPPVCLTRLKLEQRAAYDRDLSKIAEGFRKLSGEVREKTRIEKILRCVATVRTDLRNLPK
ncbi:MAG: hypothetical protein ACRD9L_27535 [Bryobacteraceae bacterium]